MEIYEQGLPELSGWMLFSNDEDDPTRPDIDDALSALVRLSGRCNGRIVILPAVCSDPVDRGRHYAQKLLLLGAGLVEVLHVEARSHANDENAVALVTQATGILMIGDQCNQLTTLLAGTELLQAIQRRQSEGCVVAATNAASSLLWRPADVPL